MGTVPYAMIQDVSSSLFRLIRGIVRDREEALDLTQDVLVKMLGRSVAENPAIFKGYAMRAAYRTALNAVRNRKRHERIHEGLQNEPALLRTSSSEQDCQDNDLRLRQHVFQALEKLSPKQREAIELRFYGDLAIDEISAAMGISDGSVKVHLYRGLNRLNEIMTTTKEEKKP